MSGCCDDNCSLDRLRERQRGTLQIVLGINAVMFFVIVAAALYGKSTALLADSLDNLGDALTYGLSLYAVSRSTAVKAKVALFKGGTYFSCCCRRGRSDYLQAFCPKSAHLRGYGRIQSSWPCRKLPLSFSAVATSP